MCCIPDFSPLPGIRNDGFPWSEDPGVEKTPTGMTLPTCHPGLSAGASAGDLK